MAQVTNTYSTYDAVGEREDLSDIIYSISPRERSKWWFIYPARRCPTAGSGNGLEQSSSL